MKHLIKKALTLSLIFVSFFELYAQEADKSMQVPDSLMSHFIEKKLEFNSAHSMAYCIQLYFGNEQNAKAISKSYKKLFPDQEVVLRYDRPWWKPQTGLYLSQREADIALKNLQQNNKANFPDALVVPYIVKE
ncbi:MAG: SPOR domain-containing protein [Flavobacteriaceae bacterium]